jgi:hypothetical protein
MPPTAQQVEDDRITQRMAEISRLLNKGGDIALVWEAGEIVAYAYKGNGPGAREVVARCPGRNIWEALLQLRIELK